MLKQKIACIYCGFECSKPSNKRRHEEKCGWKNVNVNVVRTLTLPTRNTLLTSTAQCFPNTHENQQVQINKNGNHNSLVHVIKCVTASSCIERQPEVINETASLSKKIKFALVVGNNYQNQIDDMSSTNSEDNSNDYSPSINEEPSSLYEQDIDYNNHPSQIDYLSSRNSEDNSNYYSAIDKESSTYENDSFSDIRNEIDQICEYNTRQLRRTVCIVDGSSKTRQHQCLVCCKVSLRKADLYFHINVMHLYEIPCPNCNRTFETRKSFLRHVRFFNCKFKKCRINEKLSTYENDSFNDIKNEIDQTCEYNTRQLRRTVRIVDGSSKTQQHQCLVCCKLLQCQADLCFHINVMHLYRIPCPNCSRKYESRKGFVRHVRFCKFSKCLIFQKDGKGGVVLKEGIPQYTINVTPIYKNNELIQVGIGFTSCPHIHAQSKINNVQRSAKIIESGHTFEKKDLCHCSSAFKSSFEEGKHHKIDESFTINLQTDNIDLANDLKSICREYLEAEGHHKNPISKIIFKQYLKYIYSEIKEFSHRFATANIEAMNQNDTKQFRETV